LNRPETYDRIFATGLARSDEARPPDGQTGDDYCP
jgi:hypothetical protein